MKGGFIVHEFRFKANDSTGKEYIVAVSAANFDAARDKAYDVCYHAGLCFIGRL